MDLDDEAILRTFLAESEEGLRVLEEALVAVEGSPSPGELLAAMFRAAHTLKGNALNMDLTAIGDLAHSLEDVLGQLRSGRRTADAPLVTLLLSAVDALREMIAATGAGNEIRPASPALVAALRTTAAGAPAPAGLIPSAAPEATPGAAEIAPQARTLRIDVDKLDRLLNLTGEIAVARGRLQQRLEGGAEATQAALEVHREADRLHADLQELVMKARMVPIGPALRVFTRVVRDIAAAHGKQARVALYGEDVEVDTKIVEHLRDPLTHMVRNAIDHGIETPAVRRACGKDPCGSLTLRAFHQAGSVVLEVEDDGAGLDRARIVADAVRQGLLPEGAAATISEREVHALLFTPGFSTAEHVSDLSGRGVGLDVVRRNVEALRGAISVESQIGRGTTITIRLPLTLAIIQGFAVGVGAETYVVPLDAVVECLELPASGDGDRGVLNLRGAPLPFLRLRHQFHAEEAAPTEREHVIVVQQNGMRVGLAVDTLLGETQTVIKPLGRLFRDLPGVTGSAILGNGRVALILDVPGLLREALREDLGRSACA